MRQAGEISSEGFEEAACPSSWLFLSSDLLVLVLRRILQISIFFTPESIRDFNSVVCSASFKRTVFSDVGVVSQLEIQMDFHFEV